MAPMESGPSGHGGQHGCSSQNRPCTSHNSQRPQQQQQHSTAQPIADTLSGWLDRHQGCESLTSTMATRPTAAAVTVPGRENNDPGGEHAIRAGKLVFLKDQLAGALFLADTGAWVSLIPGPPSSGRQALTAANGATIATGEERNLQLLFLNSSSCSHRFNFDFLQGSVDGPILGIDFLHHFGLFVDPFGGLCPLW